MRYTLLLFILVFSSSIGCLAQSIPEQLKDEIEAGTYPRVDGILMSQGGDLLVEAYFNGFDRGSLHQTRSSFKSITSILAGIAVDQGLFSVHDKVKKFIVEWENDPRGEISIKDLLQMKSGLACEEFFGIGVDCESEMFDTDDWLGYLLDIPLRHEPGLNWAYTSAEPHFIGVIISRASGMSVVDFARIHLFEPLGISEYEWTITPDGIGYTAGSFSMLPLDMLKIAQLVIDKGQWDGKQIVSEAWLQESTNCQTDVEMSFVRFGRTENAKYSTANYGYLWYREMLRYGDIDTEVLFASGNGGQYMMILEDYNATIAFTGSNFGSWRGKLPFDILLKYLIPMLESR
ncbi:MAG: serine hydrolase [Bacteroidota bacterium]